MAARKVSINTRAKVDRLFKEAARPGVIKSLEAGKTVHVGPHILKGEVIKKTDDGGAKAPPSDSPATSKTPVKK